MDNSTRRPTMVRTDHGEANRRILAKEPPTDFRRVEAAAITRRTSLHSAEGKRLFVRYFYTLQSRVYYISTIGRTRRSHQEIEALEGRIKEAIAQASSSIDKYMDAVEQRLKDASIDTVAGFTTAPMEEDVAIVSAIGRRYFELIHKLDQLMPLLQTLEIEELVTETELDRMRAKVKRITGRPASLARLLADKLRLEMRDPLPATQPATAAEEDNAATAGSKAGMGLGLPDLASTAAVTAGTAPQGLHADEPGAGGAELPRQAAAVPLAQTGINGTARPV
jgi:hypothetical protein